jgi:hypothetical protein
VDQTPADEIRKLKADLTRKVEAADSVEALAGRAIDRPFESDPGDLTDRELEHFIRAELEALARDAWICPDPRSVSTHRSRILMAPVLALKRAFVRAARFYSELFADPLAAYHRRTALALRAMAEQSRRDREAVEERVSRCEERLALLLPTLEDRRTGPDA